VATAPPRKKRAMHNGAHQWCPPTLLVMLVVPTWGGFQPPQTPLVKDGFMRYMLVFVAVNVVLNM